MYDEISKDKALDIVEFIKEKAKLNKDMYNYNKLDKGGFSEVYLIFDFDFQAPQYDSKKISEMVDFFDNETEYGKLYINYPMMESFKHFINLPDYNYNLYKVNKEECLNYKNFVASISKIVHFNDITDIVLKIIIKQNLDKFFFIMGRIPLDYEEYKLLFTQKNLLNIQLDSVNIDNSVYVINTSLFWGIDYFGEDKYTEYNLVDLEKI